MTLFQQITKLLPAGYRIDIGLEKGSGWAELVSVADGGWVATVERVDERRLLKLVNVARKRCGLEPVTG